MEINKNHCSVYCSCIDDTVNLTECEDCLNNQEGECRYQEQSPKK